MEIRYPAFISLLGCQMHQFASVTLSSGTNVCKLGQPDSLYVQRNLFTPSGIPSITQTPGNLGFISTKSALAMSHQIMFLATVPFTCLTPKLSSTNYFNLILLITALFVPVSVPYRRQHIQEPCKAMLAFLGRRNYRHSISIYHSSTLGLFPVLSSCAKMLGFESDLDQFRDQG
jgi:hypothetical protein